MHTKLPHFSNSSSSSSNCITQLNTNKSFLISVVVVVGNTCINMTEGSCTRKNYNIVIFAAAFIHSKFGSALIIDELSNISKL